MIKTEQNLSKRKSLLGKMEENEKNDFFKNSLKMFNTFIK